jgi:sulfur carrier protein
MHWLRSRSNGLGRNSRLHSEINRPVRASINGEEHDLPDGLTVAQLLARMRVPERGIAVAKNDRVVRRAMFEQERVNEGDRVEIIKAVAGG